MNGHRIAPLVLASALMGSSALAAEMTFTPEEMSFDSGLRILILEDHRFDLVRVGVGLQAGDAESPDDAPALAEVAVEAWRLGEHGDALAAMGCSVEHRVDADTTQVASQCTRDQFLAQVEQMGALLQGATGSVDAATLQGARAAVASDWALGGERLFRPLYRQLQGALYPDGHPYHRSTLDPSQLDGVTADAVTGFMGDHYGPDGAVIVFHGDVKLGDLMGALIDTMPPTTWHPDLTAEHKREFPADDVRFLGFDEPHDWYEDPDEPGKALQLAPAPYPSPDEAPAPAPLEGEPLSLKAGVDHPTLGMAWALPGTNAFTYWPYDRLHMVASADLRDAVGKSKGVVDSGCSSVPATHSAMLICWVEHTEDAKLGKLRDAMAGAFSRKWTGRRDRATYEAMEGFDGDVAQRTERDRGGLHGVMDMAHHLMLTNHPLYFERKYDQAETALLDHFKRTTLQYLTAERAQPFALEPAMLPTVHAKAGARLPTPAALMARVPEEPDLSGPLVDALAEDARVDEALDSGLSVGMARVDGLILGAYGLQFRNPEGVDQTTASLLDHLMLHHDKYDKGSAAPRWSVQGATFATQLLVDGKPGRWLGKYISGALERIPGEDAAVSDDALAAWKASFAASWRAPSFWTTATAYEALTGQTAPLTPDAVEAAAAQSADDLVAMAKTKFQPANARFVLVGRYDVDEAPDTVKKALGAWAAPEEAPELSFADLPVYDNASAAFLFERADDADVVDVTLTCPVDVSGLEAGARNARWSLAATAARLRLGQAIADTDGLAPTGASAGIGAGGAALTLSASVPSSQLGALVGAMGGAATGLAEVPAMEGAMPALRWATLMQQRGDADSMVDLRDLILAHTASGSSFADVAGFGGLLDGTSADDLATTLSACGGHEVWTFYGPTEAVSSVLDGAGVSYETVDWMAEARKAVGR